MGREALKKIQEQGPSRKLVGFEIESGDIVAKDNKVFLEDNIIGSITSGNFSSILNKSIAIGYVEPDCAVRGTDVEIDKEGKRHPAVVVPTPFYDPDNERVRM